MERDNHPFDYLFVFPLQGLRFLGFECVIGLFSSLIISIPSLYYVLSNQSCYSCDFLMSIWLTLFSFLRLIDIPMKIMILCKIYNYSQRIHHEDRRIMIRRLMDLVRGSLFTWQARINTLAYWVFIAGVLRIRVETNCNDSQFYQFCLTVMLTYIVRVIIGAANFKYEERKIVNRGFPEFTQFFKHGATLHDIENVSIVVVNKENVEKLRDLCAICTEGFLEGETVRVLPCAESHNFHKDCIDRWLIQKDACPLCGVSIKKIKTL